MNDYEQRIKVLEEEIEILKKTIKTLKDIQTSERIEEFIRSRERVIRVIELVNSVSSLNDKINFDEQKKDVEYKKKSKDKLDKDIKNDIDSFCCSIESDDIKYYGYELETGLDSEGEVIEELRPYVGKCYRITDYNGFNETAVIPSIIDGLPVVSIGSSAFRNTYSSNFILPSTIKALLDFSFYECKNLERIDLPESIEYIGHACFSGSGLKTIRFPHSIKVIGAVCTNCEKLKTAVIPENVEKVDGRVFRIDSATKKNSVECAFEGLNTVVFNWRFKNVKSVYCLPGSAIQKYAREHNIPIKPLSEFKMEE